MNASSGTESNMSAEVSAAACRLSNTHPIASLLLRSAESGALDSDIVDKASVLVYVLDRYADGVIDRVKDLTERFGYPKNHVYDALSNIQISISDAEHYAKCARSVVDAIHIAMASLLVTEHTTVADTIHTDGINVYSRIHRRYVVSSLNSPRYQPTSDDIAMLCLLADDILPFSDWYTPEVRETFKQAIMLKEGA